MSCVYHASVVETQTSAILRLEYAWAVNTSLNRYGLTARLGNITNFQVVAAM